MATKSIGATGRDYSTLALWAAYANALSLSAAEVGECYNDSEFTLSAHVSLGGWTGGSGTNTVTLKCHAGQSFRDNASVQSNALRYNQSNGVGFTSSVSYDYTIGFASSAAFFIMDGLQAKTTSTDTQVILIQSASGADNITLQNCIFQGTSTPGTGSNNALVVMRGNSSVIQNCVINPTNNTGVQGLMPIGNITITDCTIVSTNGSSGIGVRGDYGAVVMKNTAVAGFTTDFTGTANASSTNNATSKASFGGTNYGGSGQTSIVGATEWTSVTNGSQDFRLAAGSAKLKDNGATTGPSTDIAGTSRPQGSAYDIGCWELVAAAAGAFSPYFYREHVARAGG
jgi:hypothetical protein